MRRLIFVLSLLVTCTIDVVADAADDLGNLSPCQLGLGNSISMGFRARGYTGLDHATFLERAIKIVQSGSLLTPDTLPPKYPGAAYYPGKVFLNVVWNIQRRPTEAVSFVFDLTVLDKFRFHLAPSGYWAGRYKGGFLTDADVGIVGRFLEGNPPPLGELVVYESIPLEFLQKILISNSEIRLDFLRSLRSKNINSVNGKALEDVVRSQ